MFVVVIVSAGDGSEGYGHRVQSIRFNTRKAAEECQKTLKRYSMITDIIEDVRQ